MSSHCADCTPDGTRCAVARNTLFSGLRGPRADGGGMLLFALVAAARNPFDEYRFLASIYADAMFLCGGTFLVDDIVVTAAHCVGGFRSSMRVIDHYQEIVYSGLAQRSEFGVKCVKPFSRYAYATVPVNDMAILLLDRPRQSRSYITLDYGRYAMHAGLEVEAIAWVNYPDGSKLPRPVAATTLPQDECRTPLVPVPKPQTLCVAFPIPPRIEFGGPLIHYSPQGPILVGIFSWGLPNANRLPAIFTRVEAFTRWISDFAQFGSQAPVASCPAEK